MTAGITIDATGRAPERTPKTIAAYRVRYGALSRAARFDADDCEAAVSWFETQHERWAPATIRQHRAAIRQAITDRAETMTAAKRQRLLARLETGPRSRKKGKPRTSARKRKSILYDEFRRLVLTLNAGRHPDDRIAAQFVAHNCLLFLRPIEWQTAAIRDAYLIVQNAKSTNGRALGKERGRDLSNYGVNGVKDLTNLLACLKKQADAIGFDRFWRRLASRIARTCTRLGIRRIALYTTRHAGISNAKSWMSPEEVAASAGHKTTATATSHYAKRRTSWGPKARHVARPRPEDIEKVVSSPKATKAKNLEYLATRRTQRDAARKEEEGPDSNFTM